MTAEQALSLLQAIGSEKYMIAIRQWRPDGCGIMLPHIGPLAPNEIIDRWRQWQRRNAARADILLRVADEPPPAVLVDDLDHETLCRLRSELDASAVVETSPDNWQVWVPRPLQIDALDYSRALQRRYDADQGGVGRRQPGRLPGLTNQKPIRARADGRGPWVVLTHCDSSAKPPSEAFVAELMREGPRAAAAAAATRTPRGDLAGSGARPSGRKGKSPSEEDWALARRMYWRGASFDEVESAMLASAISRGKRDAFQYAERTARKAATSGSSTDRRSNP